MRVDAAGWPALTGPVKSAALVAAQRTMSADKKINWPAAAEKLAAALPRDRLHAGALEEMAGARGPWVVAFSGGADSLALLLLLWAHWPARRGRIVALHFNHRLRGRAAQSDEKFCRRVCGALTVKFRAGRWREARVGASEAEAREARFRFFDQELRARRARNIFFGHQQDDIAETMLMRLARGSGSGGLAAPRPVQIMPDRRRHLRPLLDLRKAGIVAALRATGIPWREDGSNVAGDYFRNRVRRSVVPAWRRAAGDRDVVAGAALARELLDEDHSALNVWLEELAPWRGRRKTILDLERLAGRPRALLRRALHAWLQAQPDAGRISRQGFASLLAAAEKGEPTRRSLGLKGFAVIRSGGLEFERPKRPRFRRK